MNIGESARMMRTQLGLVGRQLRRVDFTNSSVLSLIVANTVPLFGVLFFGWSTFAVVVVYWAENVIIGMINVLKMLVCSPLAEDADLSQVADENVRTQINAKHGDYADQRKMLATVHHASKIFFIPFFTVHYGLFCFVHGLFIFELLGGGHSFFNPINFWPHVYERLREEHLQWAVLALAASHLLSFFVNFIYRGEYRHVNAALLMMQPYGRVVVMHFAVLLGAFAIKALGSPVWMLIILIVGKTILDVGLHLAEREKNAFDSTTRSG